jgi:SH3-like domain-containing protein
MKAMAILRRWRTLAVLLVSAVAAAPLPASGQATVGTETQLPLPRFVTLRSNEINLRTGPGSNYPIVWIYQRRGMPVEVVAEFESWRKIRDWQGTVGWVHQSMLDGRRGALVIGGERILRHEPAISAAGVARLQDGVIGRIKSCEADWCRLETDSYEGWLKRDEFWGVYPGEAVE